MTFEKWTSNKLFNYEKIMIIVLFNKKDLIITDHSVTMKSFFCQDYLRLISFFQSLTSAFLLANSFSIISSRPNCSG